MQWTRRVFTLRPRPGGGRRGAQLRASTLSLRRRRCSHQTVRSVLMPEGSGHKRCPHTSWLHQIRSLQYHESILTDENCIITSKRVAEPHQVFKAISHLFTSRVFTHASETRARFCSVFFCFLHGKPGERLLQNSWAQLGSNPNSF